MLGENGHGTWAPESQEIYFGGDDTMLGENGHGQWNPEMWQEEEAGDQPWFEARSGPSGDAQSGPSGMGGGPSGDFGRADDGAWDEDYKKYPKHPKNHLPESHSFFGKLVQPGTLLKMLIPHGIFETTLFATDIFLMIDLTLITLHKYGLDHWMPKLEQKMIDKQI